VSQHHFEANVNGKPVRVLTGYDRRLREFFLTVMDNDDESEEDFVFTSLGDCSRDWSNGETVEDWLQELGIPVPKSLLGALFEDQANNVGNKVVKHHFDCQPTVVLAG